MQAIARWGNFFNQELYGTPTTLPWGIPIDCAHRIAALPVHAASPPETTRFHPLFLYESLSGAARRDRPRSGSGSTARKRLRPGDLLLLFFIWYGVVRFVARDFRARQLDVLRGPDRADRVAAVRRSRRCVILAWRHRPGHPLDDPPTHPEVATWGAIGRPVEPADVDDEFEDDDGPTTTRMTTAPSTTTRPTTATRT